MSISYDSFTGAFLSKITEYDLLQIAPEVQSEIVAGYMKRAISEFQHFCDINLPIAEDDVSGEYTVDVPVGQEDEIVNIISEGMVVQWLKRYVYHQELLENTLNTRDYTNYSAANLLYRVRETYAHAQNDFKQMMREYTYTHGDLTVLHL